MPKTHHSISTFFPCYNDGGTIGRMVGDVIRVLREVTDDFEVIVIDDGSTDNSRQLLKELDAKYDCLKLVFHQGNQGYGGALQSGFKTAVKDLIFYTDGDMQYDVRELSLLLERLGDDIDIVNGFKVKRSDAWYRAVVGRIYHWTAKIAFNLPVRDVDCDFRLMRRSIFDKVNLEHKSGVICVEMMRKISRAGFRFAEVGVHHYPRTYGSSQFFNVRNVARALFNLSRLWWEAVFLPHVSKRYSYV